MVEPASGDDGHAVKVGHARLRKEPGEEVANDAADGVAGEDIEGVVVPEYELELGGEIAQRAGEHTVQHRSGFRDSGSIR